MNQVLVIKLCYMTTLVLVTSVLAHGKRKVNTHSQYSSHYTGNDINVTSHIITCTRNGQHDLPCNSREPGRWVGRSRVCRSRGAGGNEAGEERVEEEEEEREREWYQLQFGISSM